MKILFYAFSDKDVGQGHLYRTLVLADKAEELGHHPLVVGNIMDQNRVCYQARKYSMDDFLHIAKKFNPDWIVTDLQEKTPYFVYDVAELCYAEVLNIAGVGRYDIDLTARVNIVQGMLPEAPPEKDLIFGGQNWIVLRPEVFTIHRNPGSAWFVFGGSIDRMELLYEFHEAMPEDKAMLVASHYASVIPSESENHMVYWPIDEAIFRLMGRAAKACVATGMIAWELATMGIPTYCFSWTPGHLEFAQKMEEAGLVRAYPDIGLPSHDKMREFLALEPVEPQNAPDGRGPARIIRLMEIL